jgi:hypothetical protein
MSARHVRSGTGLAVALAALVCSPCTALAQAPPAAQALQDASPSRVRWVAVSLLGGTSQPVSRLADYQWDVRPHAGWGAQVLVGRGGWSVGPRLWRSGTTQALGLAGMPDPRVSSTSLELVTRARLARWRTAECLALASGGRLAMRYQPDRLTLDTGGGTVELAFAPVDSWIAGAGVALRAPVAGGWTAGLEAERRVFTLDTAHRSGAGVTYARETFGDWHMRFELGRAWGW